MREILFRGKRMDNGEWIEGHLIQYEDGRARICVSHTDIFCYEKDRSIIQTVAHEVDPSTVGQYTGLTDKNGKRIFEGDILESHYDDEFPDDVSIEVIKWFNNCWCAQNVEHMDYEPYELFEDNALPRSEIIGNIHDNPELLKIYRGVT